MIRQLNDSKGKTASKSWTVSFITTALLIPILALGQGKLPDQSKVVELTIYTIKDRTQSTFLNARRKMLSSIRHYKGFISANSYQSLNNPSLFVDYYIWASYEDATNAAQRIQKDKRSQTFLQLIDSLKIYDYSKPIEGGLVGEPENVLADNVIEIAVYEVPEQNVEATKRARRRIFDRIRKTSSFKFARTGKSIESNLFIDYVVWSDLETALEADRKITSTKEAEAYFALVGKFHFFDRLKLIN